MPSILLFSLTFLSILSAYLLHSKISISTPFKDISGRINTYLDLYGIHARKANNLEEFFPVKIETDEAIEHADIQLHDFFQHPHYAIPQAVARFTKYPAQWYKQFDGSSGSNPQHVLYDINTDEKNCNTKEINNQNIGAAGVAVIDTYSSTLNKQIGDQIKSGKSVAANYSTLVSMAVCAGRYCYATYFRDQSQSDAFKTYTNRYREKIIGGKNGTPPSKSNVIENTDQAIFTRLAYHSQLWSSLMGAILSFLSAISSGVHSGIMATFTAVTLFKIWITNTINTTSMQISDIHNQVETLLRDNLKKSDHNDTNNDTATPNAHNAFEHYRVLYINRVTFESIVSFVGKAVDVVTKFLFLRLMLRVLLRGKFAYTALLPTLSIMRDYSRNINIAERTRKAVNPHRSAVKSLGQNKNESSNKHKKSKSKSSTSHSLFESLMLHVKQISQIPKETLALSILYVCVFIALQYFQSFFMSQSIVCLNQFMSAVANRHTALSLSLTWQILKYDISEQISKVCQRLLLRHIQSSWAYQLRLKYFATIQESDTEQSIGNLVVDDIKTATDGVMSVIEGATKLSFDLWFCWFSLYSIPNGPLIMLGLSSFTCIKYFILKSQNRGQISKDRAAARDEVKQADSFTLDNLGTYEDKARIDIQSESQYNNLSQFLTSLFKQIQVFIFSSFANNGFITTQSFPGTLSSAGVFCDATDEVCKRLSDLQKMQVAADRLDTANYFTTPRPSPSA